MLNLKVGDVVLFNSKNSYGENAGIGIGRITKLTKNAGVAWIQTPVHPPEAKTETTAIQQYTVTVQLVPADAILDVANGDGDTKTASK